jgi:Ca2+-binding RTX toxin-like protein
MAITAAMREEVSQLYVALFGRAPDGEGLGYWVQRRDAGLSVAQVANEMYATTPARTYYPSFATNSEIVTNFYVNVLGRQPDAGGLAYWTGQLNSATPGSVIASMINNVMNYGGTDAAGLVSAALFQNKAAVATAYGLANGSIAGATSILSTVTDAAATRTAALSSISSGTATGVGGAAGQTFTLTTSPDNLAGSAGIDTFNGVIIANNSTGSTANPGDRLDGGAGVDTFNITLTGDPGAAAYSVAGLNLPNIERVLVQNYDSSGGNNYSIDMALASSVTTVGATGSDANGDTTFANLKQIVSAEVSNGAGDLTVGYVSTVVAGTADTASLALSAQTGGTFTTDGIETLNVASNTSANTMVVTGNALKTINVSGSANLRLATGSTDTTALAGTVKTLDASKATGNVTAFLNTNTDISVTGGSGNDTFQTATAVSGTGFVDGGAGTDTLITTVTGTSLITTAAAGALFKNFETQGVSFSAATTANQTDDMSLVAGLTGLTIVRAEDTTDSNADFTSTITFNNVGSAVNTLSISGLKSAEDGHKADFTVAVNRKANTSADSLTVTLGTATASAGADAVASTNAKTTLAITTPNEESLSIVSQGNSNFLSTITGTELTSITLTGSKALSVDGITAANLKTINASGMTADFSMVNTTVGTANSSDVAATVTGGSGNDRLVGGTKADSISGGAGNDDIFGAAGNDVISGGTGNDTIDGGSGANNIDAGDGDDTINVATTSNFTSSLNTIVGGAGNDNLSFNEAASVTLLASQLTGISGIENITIANGNNAGSVTLTDAVFTANGTTSLAVKDGSLTQGALTVNASALTSANSVSITANTSTGVNDSLVGGAGNDTFTFGATTAALEAGDTVTGGSGTDTIVLTATAANTAVLTNVTGVEVIRTSGTGSGDADDVTITLTDGNIGSSTVTSGSITVDASSMTAAAPDLSLTASSITTATKFVSVVGGAGDDTVVGGSGNDVIQTGSGADSITGGAGVDNIDAGAGDDVIIATAAGFSGLAAAETVAGGSGNDTLNFSTDEAVTLSAGDLAAVSGIENVKFAAITNAVSVTLTDSFFTGNGTSSITIDTDAATTGNVVISASAVGAANSITVIREATNSNTADDNIVLGAGNDTVRVDNQQLAGVATINGGTGTDTLNIRAAAAGAGSGNAVTMAAGITGFETITFNTATNNYSITMADANVASGGTITVNASNLTTGTLYISAAAESNGTYSITGGVAADTIVGGQRVDTLTGGAGADLFRYSAVAQSNGTYIDSITDYSSGTDKLEFTLDYSALSTAVTVNATRVGAGVADLTTAQNGFSGERGQYVYDTGASRLYVNVNADNLVTSLDYTVGVNAGSTASATIADGDVNFSITGTSANDTITAGGGADTIAAGGGTDTIVGGAGNDTITLSVDTAQDTVILRGTGTIASGTNNVDTIADFYISTTSAGGANEDILQFGSTWLGVGFTSNTYTKIASGASAAAANDGAIVVVSDAAASTAYDTAAEVQSAFLNADMSATTVEAIIIAGSDNAMIWFYDGGLDGSAAISANDLVLIGVLTGASSRLLAVENFGAAIA